MSDLRVPPLIPATGPVPVGHDERSRQERHGHGDQRQGARRGAEELAVALDEGRRSALVARFEQDSEGQPRIRIVDRERGETVAVFTPEELRELAEHTGLPAGLLLQVSS
jgi:hypothetical protein